MGGNLFYWRMRERPFRIAGDQSVKLFLRPRAGLGHVHSSDLTFMHAQTAINKNGAGYLTSCTENNRLDRVNCRGDHGIGQVEDCNIGARADRDTPQIAATKGLGAAHDFGAVANQSRDHDTDSHVQHHVGRGCISAHTNIYPSIPARGEGLQRSARTRSHQRAMRDTDPMITIKRQILWRGNCCMRSNKPCIQRTDPRQPLRCSRSVQGLHCVALHQALRAMQPNRNIQIFRRGHHLAQQGCGAGFHPVRGQQPAHQFPARTVPATDIAVASASP